jgi:hypothetical protein
MKKSIIALAVISTTLIACLSETTPTENITQQVETLPLREVKDISFFVERIKADSAWMNLITTKAKEANVSVDEMILIDAEYIRGLDIEIIKIENDILRDSTWVDLIKKKAEEQALSFDEVIRADAEYVYEQNKLSAQPAP